MRLTALVSALSALSFFSFPQSARDQKAPAELRNYDLGALEQATNTNEVIPRLEGIFAELEATEYRHWDDEIEKSNRAFGDPDFSGFAEADWEDILLTSLCVQANDPHGDAGLQAVKKVAGILAVSADSKTQRRVESLLTEFHEQQQRTIEASVFQFPAEAILGAPFEGKLTAAEVKSLLREHSPARTYRCTIQPGIVAELGVREMQDVLWEYDTEETEESIALQPTTTAALRGTQIYVDAQRTISGCLVLRVRGRHVTEWSTRELTVELEGVPKRTLEVPRARVERFLADAAVEEGGGILVGSHSKAGSVWLIRLTSQGAAAARSNFLPTGGLTARRTRWSNFHYSGPLIGGGIDFPSAGDAEALLPLADRPHMTPSDVMRLLHQEITALDPLAPVWFGTEIYIGNHPSRDAIQKVLERESQSVERSLSFELRFDEVSSEIAKGWRALTPTDLAQRLEQKASGTLRLGSFASVKNESEHGYLFERQISSGNSAGPSEPNVWSLVDGFQLGLHALETRRGTIYLRTQFCLQRILDLERSLPVTVPRIPWNAEDRMKIELPTTTSVRLAPPLELKPGEWKSLGVSPLDGTEKVVFAVLRLTE